MYLTQKRFSFFNLFLTSLLFSSFSFGQSNFSISGSGGLAAADGNYGRSFSVNAGIPTGKKSGLELGYNYLKFENQLDSYAATRYSIVMENFIFSSDNKFRLSSKTGPSLVVYDGYDDEDSAFGIDLGLESSYNVFGSLHIDFGYVITINKVDNMMQLYLGLSYDIITRKKVK
jgi:hypothetical protein